MSVKIENVARGSYCAKAGIAPGDILVAINGNEINDILDFRFYETDRHCTLTVETDGNERTVEIEKGQYDSLGLDFSTYLMDKQKSCTNKCIFCFIDQLPKGMRESLYFKDDDSRLSFLFGNYITLTNLTDKDIDRIIKMKISPVNVSVHTTDPLLRCKMMNNRFAGDKLKYLKRLADAGIKINCQLVLCPGINDGQQLVRSLTDLSYLYPAVESVACVPLGLTKYREGLEPLVPYNEQTAAAVIDTVEELGGMMLESVGTRLFYPSDEFYILANRPLPDQSFYESYPQLENGVGMLTLLENEFSDALESREPDDIQRSVCIATGEAAYPYICRLVDMAKEKWRGLDCNVFLIKNDFFGPLITVAGLVTGGDLLKNLQGKCSAKKLLIPAVMLRSEGDLFLDSVSVDDVEKALGIPVTAVPNDGWELLDALLDD
ncbi:MAG: DUF512 domain-containing protein [Clostridia bacterium]|nr:DUF512 domain-containing protein [Clostridia bacterium]